MAREGRRAEEVEELLSVIDKQKDYIVDASADQKFRDQYMQFRQAYNNSGKRKRSAPIVGGWEPEQFIIPQTTYDLSTGKLKYIDPKTQVSPEKRRDIIRRQMLGQSRPDDPFVVIGSSAVTQFAGMFGDSTYGFGRDKTGNPVYRPPVFVKLSTDAAYDSVRINDRGERDESSSNLDYRVVNSQLAQKHRDISNGE